MGRFRITYKGKLSGYYQFQTIADGSTYRPYTFSDNKVLMLDDSFPKSKEEIELFKRDPRFEVSEITERAEGGIKVEISSKPSEKKEELPGKFTDDLLDQSTKAVVSKLKETPLTKETIEKLIAAEKAGKNRAGILKMLSEK